MPDVAELLAGASATAVRVRSPEASQLRRLLAGPGVSVTEPEAGVLVVRGLDPAQIGAVARGHHLAIHELAVGAGVAGRGLHGADRRRRRIPRHHPRREPEMAKPVTQGQVIRSEWIKLRTVRSSWLVLAATVLGIAGARPAGVVRQPRPLVRP